MTSPIECDPISCLNASKDSELIPSYCLLGVILFLRAPALTVSTPTAKPKLTLQLRETQGSSIERLHPLTLGRDVPLQQSMLLQQVLRLHQVLPTLAGQQLSLPEGGSTEHMLGIGPKASPTPHCPRPLFCSSSPSLKL